MKIEESEMRIKYLDLARKLEKLWNMKVTVIPIIIGALGMVLKSLLRGLEELSFFNPDGSIVEIVQNTEKSPGDLRRFTVAQAPVRDHQLMQKNLQRIKKRGRKRT